MCTCVRMSNFNKKKKKSLIKKINFEIVSKNLAMRFSAYISLYTSKVCTQANYVRVICFASLEKRLNPQSLQQNSFEIARVKEIGKKRMCKRSFPVRDVSATNIAAICQNEAQSKRAYIILIIIWYVDFSIKEK